MAYLLSIIARGLALVDGMLGGWTTTPTLIPGNCSTSTVSVNLSPCGEELVRQLATHELMELAHKLMEVLAATSAPGS